MISVVISTLNSDVKLAHTLASLVPAAAEGVVRDVVVVDGSSGSAQADVATVADAAGCAFLQVEAVRGERLAKGAETVTRGDFLLFLTADTVLESGWHHEVAALLERLERSGKAHEAAAVFRLRHDGFGLGARMSEFWSLVRGYLTAGADRRQGLLISRQFYRRVGGFRPLAEMEDLDLIKRIGRRRLHFLHSAAICSDQAFRNGGFLSAIRRGIARFCVGTLRLPSQFFIRLHG